MQKIGIVGAGQSGLQLAIGLCKAGYEVVMVSAQTPEQIAGGRVTSSQCMFATALRLEREVGINHWDQQCPTVDGIAFTIATPEPARAVHWAARLDAPAMSVDQRVKMPVLLRELQQLGADVRFQEAKLDDVEALAKECALVIVAAGKGAIANIFERDAARSEFDRPMRALALTYVHGLEPRPGYSAVCFNLIPGVGEYFVFPALTLSGPCEIMVFEGVPGGPMDCWAGVNTPEDHLSTSLRILSSFLPWEAERTKQVRLTDPKGTLSGRFAPTVRRPIARLPSGALVLGMADVVVLNDPITGQGSNNASKCAAAYLKRILDHGRGRFDGSWMEQTFEEYWANARFATQWTNAMLQPPAAHIVELLGAAATRPGIASWFVNGFDDPRQFYPRFNDAEAAAQLIGKSS